MSKRLGGGGGGGAHHDALRFPYLMCQLWSLTLRPRTDSDADCCHTAPSSSGSVLLAGGCKKRVAGLKRVARERELGY
jgi:hypothetical protein